MEFELRGASKLSRRETSDRGPAREHCGAERCEILGDPPLCDQGNRNRRGKWIYHLPGRSYCEETCAEEMFCTEAVACAAGYRAAYAMSLLGEWEPWACAQPYVTQHGEDAG